MLTGRHVTLRAWREDDVEFFHQLRNDVANQLSLMGEPRPHTLVDTRRWLDARTAGRDDVFLVIESLSAEKAVGFVELRTMRAVHGHASLGICLIPSARGRGWAAESLGLVERYGSDVVALRKIVLEVLNGHERAIRMYERAGYERVGVHRSHFYFAGKYHDVLLMEKMLSAASQDATVPWTQ